MAPNDDSALSPKLRAVAPLHNHAVLSIKPEHLRATDQGWHTTLGLCATSFLQGTWISRPWVSSGSALPNHTGASLWGQKPCSRSLTLPFPAPNVLASGKTQLEIVMSRLISRCHWNSCTFNRFYDKLLIQNKKGARQQEKRRSFPPT